MPPFWLVKEAVMFNFMLRRPRPQRKLPFVVQGYGDEILASFGLSHVKDSYIGDAAGTVRGISGGQRRRVSMARYICALYCRVDGVPARARHVRGTGTAWARRGRGMGTAWARHGHGMGMA